MEAVVNGGHRNPQSYYNGRILLSTRAIAIGAVAALLLNSGLLFFLRGGMGLEVVAGAVALWVGGAAAATALVAAALAAVFPRLRALVGATAVTGVVCVSGLFAIPPGRWLVERDIAAAERYGDAVVAEVTTYRQRHGAFPLALSAIALPSNPPRLARTLSYSSDGSRFTLNFDDPRGTMNWIGYDSVARRWSAWH